MPWRKKKRKTFELFIRLMPKLAVILSGNTITRFRIVAFDYGLLGFITALALFLISVMHR